MINASRRLLFKTRSQGLVSKPFRNFSAKIFKTAEEAIADIPHGASIGFGGFGMVGLPENLIRALEKKGTMDLT